jgi:hypothetical protein
VRELEMLLHQKPYMRQLCAFKGKVDKTGSDTLKVGQIDHDDIAEAVSEGSAVSANTAITDASYTLTPSRQAIKRILSNKLEIIDATGLMNAPALAAYNFAAVMKRFDAMVAAALASLTGTAGVSGATMKADDMFSAKQTLRTRRVSGKLAAILHPKQLNDLQTDMRGEVGPWQLRTDVQAAVASASGENYQGSLDGVDIWISDQVATANVGVDYGGAMLQVPGPGNSEAALAYAEGSPDSVSMAGGRIMAPGGTVYTDLDIDIDKADIQLVTNYFVAVAVALAGRGIKIITSI